MKVTKDRELLKQVDVVFGDMAPSGEGVGSGRPTLVGPILRLTAVPEHSDFFSASCSPSDSPEMPNSSLFDIEMPLGVFLENAVTSGVAGVHEYFKVVK